MTDKPMSEEDMAKFTEKQRRVYYQNIVYSVCNSLDRIFGTHVVCGTIGEPHTEVEDLLRVLEKIGPVPVRMLRECPDRVRDAIMRRGADILMDEWDHGPPTNPGEGTET